MRVWKVSLSSTYMNTTDTCTVRDEEGLVAFLNRTVVGQVTKPWFKRDPVVAIDAFVIAFRAAQETGTHTVSTWYDNFTVSVEEELVW